MDQAAPKYLAFGSRLLGIPEVLTLGVRPNFHDYSPQEQQKIHGASVILYPTLNYAQFFTTIGKKIFPSLETYLYADEKMKQILTDLTKVENIVQGTWSSISG